MAQRAGQSRTVDHHAYSDVFLSSGLPSQKLPLGPLFGFPPPEVGKRTFGCGSEEFGRCFRREPPITQSCPPPHRNQLSCTQMGERHVSQRSPRQPDPMDHSGSPQLHSSQPRPPQPWQPVPLGRSSSKPPYSARPRLP